MSDFIDGQYLKMTDAFRNKNIFQMETIIQMNACNNHIRMNMTKEQYLTWVVYTGSATLKEVMRAVQIKLSNYRKFPTLVYTLYTKYSLIFVKLAHYYGCPSKTCCIDIIDKEYITFNTLIGAIIGGNSDVFINVLNKFGANNLSNGDIIKLLELSIEHSMYNCLDFFHEICHIRKLKSEDITLKAVICKNHIALDSLLYNNWPMQRSKCIYIAEQNKDYECLEVLNTIGQPINPKSNKNNNIVNTVVCRKLFKDDKSPSPKRQKTN